MDLAGVISKDLENSKKAPKTEPRLNTQDIDFEGISDFAMINHVRVLKESTEYLKDFYGDSSKKIIGNIREISQRIIEAKYDV